MNGKCADQIYSKLLHGHWIKSPRIEDDPYHGRNSGGPAEYRRGFRMLRYSHLMILWVFHQRKAANLWAEYQRMVEHGVFPRALHAGQIPSD
jgi:hypothetical protein